jgi:formylglycine-generating enzyme required for sulfatase activity
LKTLICFFLSLQILEATNLQLEQLEWFKDDATQKMFVKLNLRWENAWHNAKNRDAVWLFFKLNAHPLDENVNYRHINIALSGHQLLQNHLPNSPSPEFEVVSDRVGLFVYSKNPYRGAINWTILIALEEVKNENLYEKNLGAYGIEMVLIPEGKFTIGEKDSTLTRKNASFFKSDSKGKPIGFFTIENEENSIEIAAKANALYYLAETKAYQGDQSGIIPTTFPKGFQAFYMMKYELSQGQYADFLNSISITATYQRANFGGRDYQYYRGSIRLENGKYMADSPQRPANFISWDDACAFADWAGLRPFSELEYEKACRGISAPISGEYAWNTNTKEKLMQYVNQTNDLVYLHQLSETNLNDSNRENFGASYYWVMDLAGSVWERCVTVGDSVGRNFKGSHGDGVLTYGFATNFDWPSGSTETQGFGFRGGGYYTHLQLYGGLNPHATIANRTFAAWSGGMRSKAYGSRFVRTAR